MEYVPDLTSHGCKKHPLYSMHSEMCLKGFDKDAALNKCIDFSKSISMKYCVQVSKRCATDCDCFICNFSLRALGSDDLYNETHKHIGETMVKWASYERCHKFTFARQWFQSAHFLRSRLDPDRHRCFFTLPDLTFVGNEREDWTDQGWGVFNGAVLCRNAIAQIFCIGPKFLEKVKIGMSGGSYSRHALTGLVGVSCNRNKGRKGMYDSIHEFLTKLKDEAAPFSTRYIRDETGQTTRNDDINQVYLPPHYSLNKVTFWLFLNFFISWIDFISFLF